MEVEGEARSGGQGRPGSQETNKTKKNNQTQGKTNKTTPRGEKTNKTIGFVGFFISGSGFVGFSLGFVAFFGFVGFRACLGSLVTKWDWGRRTAEPGLGASAVQGARKPTKPKKATKPKEKPPPPPPPRGEKANKTNGFVGCFTSGLGFVGFSLGLVVFLVLLVFEPVYAAW